MKLNTPDSLSTRGRKYRTGNYLLFCIVVLGICCQGSMARLERQANEVNPLIRLNQIGFYPAAEKLAIIQDSLAGERAFAVLRTDDDREVFSGFLTEPEHWPYAGEWVRRADFSELEEPGQYYLSVSGLGHSHSFRIEPLVHQGLLQSVLKSFYYQRCSAPLEAPEAALWPRRLGHPDDSVVVHASAASANRPEGTVIAAPGGWYDAGDYGKYVPTATFSVWELLHLYENYPQYFQELNLDLPESANELPDILDECLWELRFLLQMQEPEEGYVYHKLTTPKHAKRIVPGQDLAPRYVYGKSTAATLSFAASMAQAYRVYEPLLPGFADSCLQAARKAWTWGRQHPEQGFANPPGVFTGVCRDNFFEDDRNWAAVELFISTREDSFLRAAPSLGAERLKQTPSRRNVHALPYYALLLHPEALAATRKDAEIKRVFYQLADRLRLHAREGSSYRMPMGHRRTDFNWGSNGFAASMGQVLLIAWKDSGDPQYLQAAVGALDYIVGRNPLSLCFCHRQWPSFASKYTPPHFGRRRDLRTGARLDGGWTPKHCQSQRG